SVFAFVERGQTVGARLSAAELLACDAIGAIPRATASEAAKRAGLQEAFLAGARVRRMRVGGSVASPFGVVRGTRVRGGDGDAAIWGEARARSGARSCIDARVGVDAPVGARV